jgi:hypothetical protein
VISRPYDLWVIGGLDPKLRGLPVGPLPDGSFFNKEHGPTYPCRPTSEEWGVTFYVYALREAGVVKGVDFEDPDSEYFGTLKRLTEVSLAKGTLRGIYGHAQ